MFSTKTVSESKFISPGVREVKITSIEAREANGLASPSLIVTFTELGTEKTASDKLSFSDKATKYSLGKIKHIATKIVPVEAIDSIEAENITSLAKAYSELLTNKPFRMRFTGQEIQGKDGKNNWVKATIPFSDRTRPFAEPIATTPTQLTFNADTDVKKLVETTSTPVNTNTTKTADLPF